MSCGNPQTELADPGAETPERQFIMALNNIGRFTYLSFNFKYRSSKGQIKAMYKM